MARRRVIGGTSIAFAAAIVVSFAALMDWLASLTEKRVEGSAHPGPVAP